jgi:hypothetical protein
MQLHDHQRQFDLLSVFEELIDQMAWSRLLAYLLNKLYKKIIKKCWIIADNETIDLRQSYTQVIKKLGNQQRFKNTKNGAKAARKAGKRIKIIAGRLVREIARKLPLSRLGAHLPALKLISAGTFSKTWRHRQDL